MTTEDRLDSLYRDMAVLREFLTTLDSKVNRLAGYQGPPRARVIRYITEAKKILDDSPGEIKFSGYFWKLDDLLSKALEAARDIPTHGD